MTLHLYVCSMDELIDREAKSLNCYIAQQNSQKW